MPGASGLCKNRECENPNTGKRRQAQTGLGGYCRTCARRLLPTARVHAQLQKANAQQRHARRHCYYCSRSEDSVERRRCDCGRFVMMCDSCCAVNDAATCHACYTGWKDLCYRCGAKRALQDWKSRPVPASRDRYCRSCMLTVTEGAAEMPCDPCDRYEVTAASVGDRERGPKVACMSELVRMVTERTHIRPLRIHRLGGRSQALKIRINL